MFLSATRDTDTKITQRNLFTTEGGRRSGARNSTIVRFLKPHLCRLPNHRGEPQYGASAGPALIQTWSNAWYDRCTSSRYPDLRSLSFGRNPSAPYPRGSNVPIAARFLTMQINQRFLISCSQLHRRRNLAIMFTWHSCL